MLDRVNETIVAISSAPGASALGVVRLGGSQALSIAERLCGGASPLRASSRCQRIPVEVCINVRTTLPAAYYLFRAPHSYTREDIVEIHTVGSPVALELVRKACIAYGALAAEPGEFTARAFFNGALDLAQAEAVASVIRAQSDTQLRASRRMMDGALALRLASLRDRLGELLALVEADIDFAEEPIDFITPDDLHWRLRAIIFELQELLAQSPAAERLEQLPRILLLGPPNAGKSSLMNRLTGTSRAICAAVAGTTRDILSAPIRLQRGEAILLDSAGVDESEDQIIAKAREMALCEAQRVDLICLVLDATQLSDGETATVAGFIKQVRSLELPQTVIAANKIDLLEDQGRSECLRHIRALEIGQPSLISALTGEGIEEFRGRFLHALGEMETTAQSEAILMTARQRTSMHDAARALEHAADLASTVQATIDCADLLAFELREALDYLGSVTGTVTTEDILAHVFANFCIGK